jgi:hypothetical protein
MFQVSGLPEYRTLSVEIDKVTKSVRKRRRII